MVPAAALRKGMQERGASRLKEADYTIAASALDGAAPSRKCFFVRREVPLVEGINSAEFTCCVTVFSYFLEWQRVQS